MLGNAWVSEFGFIGDCSMRGPLFTIERKKKRSQSIVSNSSHTDVSEPFSEQCTAGA